MSHKNHINVIIIPVVCHIELSACHLHEFLHTMRACYIFWHFSILHIYFCLTTILRLSILCVDAFQNSVECTKLYICFFVIALYREKQRCILNESLLRVKSRLSKNEHFRSVAIFKVAFVLYMLLDILAVYWKTIGSLWCRSQQPGQWFSPVSSTNKTDRHDIAELLLKVALNTINPSTVW